MELVYDYMRDDALRHALNNLTRKTFCFDFEDWVTGGYFEGDYIPYSFMEDGKIISNVSANRMRFMQNGVIKNYIQIGTVMTDEEYRRQGLAGKLMKHVIKQYEKECDGIFLFGDLSAKDFYRKMMFEEGVQYRYFVKNELCSTKLYRNENISETFVSVKELDSDIKRKYLKMVRNSGINSSFEQINKYGLQMFYTADMENVYYAADIDCFIVMSEEENDICLQSVLCKDQISIKDVLQRVNKQYDQCRLGFTPSPGDVKMCITEKYDGGEDYRFFYLGKELEAVQNEKLYFPDLSHA